MTQPYRTSKHPASLQETLESVIYTHPEADELTGLIHELALTLRAYANEASLEEAVTYAQGLLRSVRHQLRPDAH